MSTDGFGDLPRAELDGAGVDHTPSPTSGVEAALAFVVLSGGQADHSFHDAESAHRGLTLDPANALPQAVRGLCLGGISIAAEPCGTTFEALLRRERRGRVVVLDPSIRPAFIGNETAYRARLDRMLVCRMS